MARKIKHISSYRYCLLTLAAFIALLGFIACFNAIIDPFNMYGKVKIEGININKPTVYSRMRLYKAFEVERVQPQTIILGSSRTHLGISCSHEALARLEAPCYNLAFDGATAKEMYYYLHHADAVRPLKHVVLGLDLYHASNSPAIIRPDFDEFLLYSDNLPHWLRFITADLRLLTSFDMLRASIQTLRSQSKIESSWFSPDGQRLGEVFFRQVQPTFVKEGARTYFDEIDQQEIRDQIVPAATKKNVETPVNSEENSISYVRRIIEFCRNRNIDLRIFITPSHAHQSETSAALWGEDSLTSGKRELVKLLANDAAAYHDKAAIPLFDFSGYSEITTEPLPPVGSREEMRYYWDSSHFKQVVGDYVLNRLFNISDKKMPTDFGVELTAKNIDSVLDKQKQSRAEYRKDNFEEVAKLRSRISGLPILVYHQILTKKDEKADKSTSITLAEFEAQMRYLHEQDYKTLSMDEVISYLQGDLFPTKIVAIHFDDGWQSALDALPVLKRFGFKASFWIIAGTGDTGWPHMDWNVIHELAKNYNIDIYPHTMTHPWKNGDTLLDWTDSRTKEKGIKQASWELTESKRLLEEKLGRQMPYLAWPRGLYNDILIKLAQKAGYRALLTIDDGLNNMGGNPLFIHRTMISGGCDISVFKQILADGRHHDCLN